MAASRGTAMIKQMVEFMVKEGHDTILQKMRVLSAGKGSCQCELTIESEHLNRGGTLHGGLTSTLVDSVSTLALMTEGNGVPGVSVNLNVSFLSAGKPGDHVIIDAQTSKLGKSLAFLTVDVSNKETGKLLAQGTHTKFVGSS